MNNGVIATARYPICAGASAFILAAVLCPAAWAEEPRGAAAAAGCGQELANANAALAKVSGINRKVLPEFRAQHDKARTLCAKGGASQGRARVMLRKMARALQRAEEFPRKLALVERVYGPIARPRSPFAQESDAWRAVHLARSALEHRNAGHLQEAMRLIGEAAVVARADQISRDIGRGNDR